MDFNYEKASHTIETSVISSKIREIEVTRTIEEKKYKKTQIKKFENNLAKKLNLKTLENKLRNQERYH
jgi:hypothetical protein